MVVALALLLSPILAEVLLRLDGYRPSEAREEIQTLVDRVLGDQAGRDADPGSQGKGQARRAGGQVRGSAGTGGSRLLHPFFGYDAKEGSKLIDRYVELHLSEERDKHFTVLVCGGSAAEIFVGVNKGGSAHLKNLLAAHPKLQGRKVHIQRLARAGYKQPQQLTKLAYFLAHGCRPDVVLNLDGYNEIKLGIRNATVGSRIDFPSANHWQHLAANTQSGIQHQEEFVAMLVARRDFLVPCQTALQDRTFDSALTGRFLQNRAQRAFRALVAAESAYSDALAGAGPRKSQALTTEQRLGFVESAVRLWSESSRGMHLLAEGVGATYIHCLQPSLQDPGSKIMTATERRKALAKQPIDPHFKGYYDELRSAGAALARDGVDFLDLSHIFAEVEETLFYDHVHVGTAGNRRLAQRFADEIIERLE